MGGLGTPAASAPRELRRHVQPHDRTARRHARLSPRLVATARTQRTSRDRASPLPRATRARPSRHVAHARMVAQPVATSIDPGRAAAVATLRYMDEAHT